MKGMKYIADSKFKEVYVCQKLSE